MTRLWGAQAQQSGDTLFRLWAPGRDTVTLDVEGRLVAMVPEAEGWFSARESAPPGTRYRFLIGDLPVPDPASRLQSGGVHGWSVVVPDADYPWRHPDWQGRPWTDAVIQEVHVGTAGGYTGLIGELPRLAEIGITAIELMPIGAFSGSRNWGYDGVLPFAPAESYGSPDELRALIDAAHGYGLMVLLDVVYNHFGPDGNYLSVYAPDFFHAEIETPWGGAVAVDQPAVTAYFLENALMWLNDYRFDGLRFDAVHAIGDPAFLDGMARSIRAGVEQGRHVHLILENEENDAARLGPSLFDAQWNDDFHNVVHVLLTGESSAYYGDFADQPTERLARCLEQGFIYQGEPSANHDGRPRGTPSGHLSPYRFISFLQNHDQVGNRALGERLTQLVDPPRLRAATALLLLSPQVPLLFMGDEFGARSPFLFFTDFHDELADAVREGRRREFVRFEAFSDEAARACIPDPNAETTFAASRPVPPEDAAEWEALYRALLSVRSQVIMPRLAGAWALGASVLGEGAVRARWCLGDRSMLTIAVNLGGQAVNLPPARGKLIHEEGSPGEPASFVAWWAEP